MKWLTIRSDNNDKFAQPDATTARPRTRRRPSTPPIVLGGQVSGMGVSSIDPASGNFANNLPLPGARLEVFAIDPATGDKMSFDGQSPPPGALTGAGVSSSKIKPAAAARAVVAEFNGERVIGRTWPAADNHVAILEMTY